MRSHLWSRFLLFILFCECLAILAWAFARHGGAIEYPALTAAVFFGWVFPQLLGLRHSSVIPAGALVKTVFMASLCIFAAWSGYCYKPKRGALRCWDYDRKRLALVSLLLSLLGAFFVYKVDALANSEIMKNGGQWTGPITIYAFLSELLSVGLAIAWLLFLSCRSIWILAILLFDLGVDAHAILIAGRRGPCVELGLILLYGAWFRCRWAPPRSAVAAVFIIGTLVINSIGDYRSVMLKPNSNTWSGAGLSAILNIDFVGNLSRIIAGYSGDNELSNAAMNIQYADETDSFDYGLSFWNEFVHWYIPGQLIGREAKDDLLTSTGVASPIDQGYFARVGTTSTGMSSAFLSFWYFGSLEFFLIGLIMGRWYRSAMNGSTTAQLVSMLAATNSLQAITHLTNFFFLTFIWIAAFLLPGLLFAKLRKRPELVEARVFEGRLYAR